MDNDLLTTFWMLGLQESSISRSSLLISVGISLLDASSCVPVLRTKRIRLVQSPISSLYLLWRASQKSNTRRFRTVVALPIMLKMHVSSNTRGRWEGTSCGRQGR